jgi:plastocyanin
MFRALKIGTASLIVLLAAGGARAQSGGNLEQTVAQLQREVRELRQMLIQAMQVEQQHHDLLLKLIQSGGAPGSQGGRTPGPGTEPVVTESPPPTSHATVTGKVQLTGAAAGQPAFVFIEDLRPPPVRGNTIEIVQKDKQFSPQVSAVPVGTRASFPNRDPVFHNAFSLSRGNAFDLSLKAGERGAPVQLSRPGVVEVYCDIHAKMWAEILVTPNRLVARVAPDGTFSLPDVPVGERVVAAWTAGARPVKRSVQVTGAGARVELSLKTGPRPAHNKKTGDPYDSYPK